MILYILDTLAVLLGIAKSVPHRYGLFNLINWLLIITYTFPLLEFKLANGYSNYFLQDILQSEAKSKKIVLDDGSGSEKLTKSGTGYQLYNNVNYLCNSPLEKNPISRESWGNLS